MPFSNPLCISIALLAKVADQGNALCNNGTASQLGEKLWVFAAVAPSRVFSAALWAGYGVPVHLFRPFFAAGRDTSPAQTWA
jgi:hypothetical protein